MKKRYSRTLLIATAALVATSTQALANPNGGSVVAGQAIIAQTAPAQVTITQSTDKAIINWNSFSIGAGEKTRFVQPSSNSITLNRVTGPDVSQILGQLTANGRIVLVNPNGVFFGKDSQVDVAALIATSHDIKNDDFMAGKLNFTIPGKPSAQIINQGKITVQEGGLVALVAPSVQNSGLIIARLGKVALASANSFTIDLYGDNLILFEADSAITSQLKDALGNPLSAAVENSDTIEANGGWVLLTAEVAKNVVDKAINMTGHIKATTVDQQEGTIILKAMGGEVAVTGTLDASAPNGGDGGFIETSGAHVTIDPAATITTAASWGATGRWLIDPTDYTIAASGGNITGASLATYLGANNIEIQTLATGSSGQGDIFVNDAVTWNNFNKLTLTAHRNINVNAAINATGGGSVKLRADSLGTGTGTVAFGGSGHVTVNNGAAVGIYYNPISYTDVATQSSGNWNPYSSKVTLNSGSYMKAYMLVNNVDQLQAINTNLAGNYALGKNMDASATAGWNSGAGFLPIAPQPSIDQYSPFTGSLDGQYYTISSLTINRPGENRVGLFRLTMGSTISNVGLVNCSVSGSWLVGGLVGDNGGTINSSYATGSVSGAMGVGGLVGRNLFGTISNSYATANVSGGSQVGGLVGDNNDGTISNSYATGNVSGGAGEVGGLVGLNSGGTINNSYATANVSGGWVVGGLVGNNATSFGTISNSYATGSVSGEFGQVGGLVGSNADNSTVSNSFWDTTTSGWASSSGGIGLSTAQMKQQASYAGWDFTNTWQIVEGVSRPTLKVASAQSATVLTPTGDVPPENPFIGLDANSLYAAVISYNLATSYSSDAYWLDLKTSNGGNATQAQITANIMLNAYNRYKAYSGQALADKLYQDIAITPYSYGGITITNDSGNLLWQGSKGSSLVSGTGQVNANIMLQSFNYYSTTDKRSGYSLFADILRGSVILPGVGTQTITNSSDNLVWRGIYGWSSSHTGATEVQIAVNDMKNTRDSYYNRMDKVQELYEVVKAGTTIATNPNFGNRYNNWLALSDGWENGSANLTMSSVQRAVKAKLLLAADAAADAAVQGNNAAQLATNAALTPVVSKDKSGSDPINPQSKENPFNDADTRAAFDIFKQVASKKLSEIFFNYVADAEKYCLEQAQLWNSESWAANNKSISKNERITLSRYYSSLAKEWREYASRISGRGGLDKVGFSKFLRDLKVKAPAGAAIEAILFKSSVDFETAEYRQKYPSLNIGNPDYSEFLNRVVSTITFGAAEVQRGTYDLYDPIPKEQNSKIAWLSDMEAYEKSFNGKFPNDWIKGESLPGKMLPPGGFIEYLKIKNEAMKEITGESNLSWVEKWNLAYDEKNFGWVAK